MAVFNEPSQWSHTLGNNADVASLPDDTGSTTGLASLSKLFQAINQTPLSAGGIAPARTDFNALFKVLGDYIFYLQNGGVPAYNPDFDYVVGRLVLFTDGNIWKCIQPNTVTVGGETVHVAPDSVDPVGSDYWKQIDAPDDSTSLIPNQIIQSPVPLTDANLHLLDGALLSGSGAYAEYVTMMGALHDADPTANIWTDEATWQASVTSTGSCGKFVYDSVNNTLRLPKYDARYLKSTLSASDLGDLVNAQAPNITGSFNGNALNAMNVGTSFMQGAFWLDNLNTMNGVLQGGNVSMSIGFDASKSNPIYKDSANTIDTDAVKVYYYIVLGTVSKTQIQIDIDNVMADLANKADKDFSNVSAPVQAFKNMSIGWGRPDWSAVIDITSSRDSYTATVDGWIFGVLATAGTTYTYAYINGYMIGEENQDYIGIQAPLNAGDTFTCSAGTIGTSVLYFVPCKGAN